MSEDPPSLSRELSVMLQDIRESLVESISTHSFLNILGKDREKFELAFSEYVNKVNKIESIVCQYLDVSFFV